MVDGAWFSAAKEATDKPGQSAFMRRFRSRAGRDPRILAHQEVADGRRFISLIVALNLFLLKLPGQNFRCQDLGLSKSFRRPSIC